METVEPVAGGYAVRFRNGRARRAEVWQAPRVVLAAGTLDALRILFRSSVAGGLGPIGHLGQHVSLGADTLDVYRIPGEVAPSAVDGHSADWMLEVPDAQGDR